MCDPTAMLALRAAGTILQISQGIKEQRAAQQQAYRQNEIAERARIQKENAENLRLRQVAIRKRNKIYDLSIEAKEKRATALTAAETVGGGVLDRVLNNYFRLEGRYRSQIEKNLELEIAQSNQNKKLFAMEQEGRQVIIPEVNTLGIFASAAGTFGNDYLEWKTKQEEKKITQNKSDNMIRNFSTGRYPYMETQ